MYKYRYINSGNTVVAISSFAGKTVKGVAKCDPEDTFSLEAGKELAAARCNRKITTKRKKCAKVKLDNAIKALEEAKANYEFMDKYYRESVLRDKIAKADLDTILERL